MRFLCPVTIALALLCACGSSAEPDAIDFGEVALGTSRSIVRNLATPITQVDVQHLELTARIGAGGTRLELVYQPTSPGQLEALIQLTSASGAGEWAVRGTAKPSEVQYFPEVLEVPDSGSAEAWLWLQPDLEIAIAPESPLRLCPGAPCLELISKAADRGLPATVRVHGPLSAPTSIVLSTCDHPACRVEIPVQATAGCGPLVFAAAPVGQDSLRTLTCSGDELATAGHPELSVIDSSTAAVWVQWSPSTPGPFEAELTRGGQRHVVRGYAVEAPPCHAEVGPSPVVFGAVQLGGFHEEEVSVRALGPEPCLLSGADADGPGFTMQAPPPHWIAPDDQTIVQVRFAPGGLGLQGGQGRLWLSDDSEGPTIELAGRGVDSDLELLTEALDFGEIETCARRSLNIRILNRGHAPGSIVEARISGEDAESMQTNWPQQVPAATLVSVPVFLVPNFSGTLDATLNLQLEGSGARTSYEVPITASVSPDFGVVTDEFMQLPLPKADVVFVIDPVGPLSPALETMQANLQSFAQFTVARHGNTNAMVVSGAASSTESAGFEPHPGTQRSVFTQDDPDFESAFVETALAVARRAPAPNRAMANLYAAVTSSAATGVIRPEAGLWIVAVSLRDDGSEEDVDSWLNRFVQIKGRRNSRLFSYSAVVGDVPDGCDNGDFEAQAAPRHIRLANGSGGVFQSICRWDWARTLENQATFGYKSRFFLSGEPVVETIEITVNEAHAPQRTTSGAVNWTYNLATNSIDFSPFGVPEPESRIAVKYRRACR